MRIFKQGYKINFVDTKDVLVGFDNGQDCCENFGYCLSLKIPTCDCNGDYGDFTPDNLDLLIFDKEWFKQLSKDEDGDGGGLITFKLINPNDTEDIVYLSLYNHHNGYYSHGFEVSVGGEIVKDGAL